MTDLSNLPLYVLLPVCFLGGLFIGFGYFRALRETAKLLVNGGKPLRAIALTLGRISLLASGFFVAVLLGGLALLAAFAGVLCARWIMLRRMREIRA
ncbi:ATP synthase subunit I [Jannaschia faecimaris]|nr:ATP synthase subunit I [Jannaschia faecimaris]